MYRFAFACLSLAATASQAATTTTTATTAASDLQLTIQGVTPDKGSVIVSVYADADSWLKRDKAVEIQKVQPTGKDVSMHLKLKPGTYAIQIFQDENNNDKLDMHWLPPGPDEPWVVSNNAQGRMGPPSFKDAKFELPGDLSLAMTLQQP